MPMKKVTNMLLSFTSAIESFMIRTMAAGLSSWAETVRKRLLVTAITKEAGMPLPLTSPMQKISFSSRM